MRVATLALIAMSDTRKDVQMDSQSWLAGHFCIHCFGGAGSTNYRKMCDKCGFVICAACMGEGRGCINKGSCDEELIAAAKAAYADRKQRTFYPWAIPNLPDGWPGYVRSRGY